MNVLHRREEYIEQFSLPCFIYSFSSYVDWLRSDRFYS